MKNPGETRGDKWSHTTYIYHRALLNLKWLQVIVNISYQKPNPGMQNKKQITAFQSWVNLAFKLNHPLTFHSEKANLPRKTSLMHMCTLLSSFIVNPRKCVQSKIPCLTYGLSARTEQNLLSSSTVKEQLKSIILISLTSSTAESTDPGFTWSRYVTANFARSVL